MPRRWWSVLSAPEYDDLRDIDDAAAEAFYASGDEAVTAALLRATAAADQHGVAVRSPRG